MNGLSSRVLLVWQARQDRQFELATRRKALPLQGDTSKLSPLDYL